MPLPQNGERPGGGGFGSKLLKQRKAQADGPLLPNERLGNGSPALPLSRLANATAEIVASSRESTRSREKEG